MVLHLPVVAVTCRLPSTCTCTLVHPGNPPGYATWRNTDTHEENLPYLEIQGDSQTLNLARLQPGITLQCYLLSFLNPNPSIPRGYQVSVSSSVYCRTGIFRGQDIFADCRNFYFADMIFSRIGTYTSTIYYALLVNK